MADLMQQAREFLTAAWIEAGWPPEAAAVLASGNDTQLTVQLSAIAAALRAAPTDLAERHAAAERDACRWARIAEEQKQRADALEARLRAAPEGFALVPVKPTPEMLAAVGNGADGLKRRIWRGMLAARPQGVK